MENFISIIIPTRDRASQLEKTLESLVSLCANQDFCEVIVIDNGSTDRTKEICSSYVHVLPGFQYVYDAEPGMLTGRHQGAELAKGDILTFIDDDVELSAGWLTGIREMFIAYPDVHFVTGPCLPHYETEPPSWLENFWIPAPNGGKMCGWLSLLDLGEKETYIDPVYVWGLNFSIRKKSLYDLGGFHPDCIPQNLQQFQGDGETGLCIKGRMLGYKALYSPKVKLFHIVSSDRLTVSYFEKRAFYQGVCDSYTALREESGLYDGVISKIRGFMRRRSFLSLRGGGEKNNKNKIIVPSSYGNLDPVIRRAVDNKYREGYFFHQNAFKNSKKVRDWILKKDYWNYKLPL